MSDVNEIPASPTRSTGLTCPWYVWAIGLAALFAGVIAGESHLIAKHKTGAFATYYSAAAALRTGHDPYVRLPKAYPYVYPPFYAFVLQPLARLSREAAAGVMLAVNSAFILAALLLGAQRRERLGRRPSLSGVLRIALTTSLIGIMTINKELRLQAGALLLLSFVLALYWLDRWPVCAGLALAVAISVKYVPLIALPYLLLRRRWTAVAGLLAGVVGLALLPAASLGWSTNLQYLKIAQGGLTHILGAAPTDESAQVNDVTHESNMSITSTLARVAIALGRSKSEAMALVLAVAALFGVAVAMIYRVHDFPLLRWPRAKLQAEAPYRGLVAVEWAGLVTLAMAFSPSTQLVQAVVPVTVLAALLWLPAPANHARLHRLILTIATILMIVALALPNALLGHPLTLRWNAAGLPSWCLLLAYLALCWAGLARLRDMENTPSKTSASTKLAAGETTLLGDGA